MANSTVVAAYVTKLLHVFFKTPSGYREMYSAVFLVRENPALPFVRRSFFGSRATTSLMIHFVLGLFLLYGIKGLIHPHLRTLRIRLRQGDFENEHFPALVGIVARMDRYVLEWRFLLPMFAAFVTVHLLRNAAFKRDILMLPVSTRQITESLLVILFLSTTYLFFMERIVRAITIPMYIRFMPPLYPLLEGGLFFAAWRDMGKDMPMPYGLFQTMIIESVYALARLVRTLAIVLILYSAFLLPWRYLLPMLICGALFFGAEFATPYHDLLGKAIAWPVDRFLRGVYEIRVSYTPRFPHVYLDTAILASLYVLVAVRFLAIVDWRVQRELTTEDSMEEK